MIPLNHLINYSSELTQSPSFFAKNVASRFITAVAIPFELLAVLENTIKLPFQTAAAIIKIPAKIVNVVANSMSLKEFESKLSSPLDVIITAIKIVGFAIGFLFTATLGLVSPQKNFHLHCSLSLISNHHAQRIIRLEKENKQKEIDSYEKIIENRLRNIVDAMRQQSQTITYLTPEQREEIETITNVNCPSIEDIFQAPTIIEDNDPASALDEIPLENDEPVLQNEEPILEFIEKTGANIASPDQPLDESPINQEELSEPQSIEDSEELHELPEVNTAMIIPFSEPSETEEENTQVTQVQEIALVDANELVNDR
ncbi:MAG TPA: hypothetical protein VGP47_01080 [Parachlamydiaceae bacterium]|nr:hypothetical protein [Parachlamydiaceae bacterium]